MRKAIFVRTFSCYIAVLLLVAPGEIRLRAFAQSTTQAAAPTEAQATATAKDAPFAAMPKDPKELMLLAAKSNGLTGDDVKPWHLKASWKMLDEMGTITDQGNYEEFWASPTQYKVIFTSSGGALTIYGTDHGPIYSGYDAEMDTIISATRLSTIHVSYVNPLWSAGMSQRTFVSEHRTIDHADQLCISVSTTPPMPDQQSRLVGTYCFDSKTLFLRSILPGAGATRFISNRPVTFVGRFLPGDLEIDIADKRSLTTHLESIESFTTADESVFIPPPGAGSKNPKVYGAKVNGDTLGTASATQESTGKRAISISSGVAAGMLIKKVDPVYPPIALAARVQGTVVLQAVIGTNGRIENLRVISGPTMLQRAALDAVKQWVYKPCTSDGEPVEVDTTIKLVFEFDPRDFGIPRSRVSAFP